MASTKSRSILLNLCRRSSASTQFSSSLINRNIHAIAKAGASATSPEKACSTIERTISIASFSTSSFTSSTHNLIKIKPHNVKRYLSNIDASASAEPSTSSSTETVTITKGNQKYRERPPSILATLTEPYTPGQALRLLQVKGAGGSKIRLSEFQSLSLAARSSRVKDAKVIRTALLDFKRCNEFYVTEECCKVAMEGMLRSLLPRTGYVQGKDKIRAGIWIAEAFLDERTGLYYATESRVLEEVVLKTLLEGMRDCHENGDDLTTSISLNEDGVGEDDGEGVDLVADMRRVTKQMIHSLLRRVSNPAKKMKKRAARKYMKHLKCSSGPFPPTVDLAVQICLETGANANMEDGIKDAREIVDAFENMRFLGKVWDETRKLVDDAEEKLLAEVAAAAEAAAAEAELEEEENEDKDDHAESEDNSKE